MAQNKEKKQWKAHKKQQALASLSKDVNMSLSGFKATEQPDKVAIKQVYSDFRTMTASTNQAEYVYRLNSLFDPDFTGVGGQPDGFDQWKALYNNYRVVACGVEVEAVGGNGFGLLAIAPTTTSTAISSAEEVAGLRRSKSQVFTTTQRARVSDLYHISEVFGWNDMTVLSDSSCSAAVTTSPASQAYVHVAAETSGASDIVYFRILLTYYSRFEVPFVLIDSLSQHHRPDFHKRRFLMQLKQNQASAPPQIEGSKSVVDAAAAADPAPEVTTISQQLAALQARCDAQALVAITPKVQFQRSQSERTLGK